MPEDLTLATAIARLLDAKGWPDSDWSLYLHCSLQNIELWRTGGEVPSDQDMTSIIEIVEHTNGSESAPDAESALQNFWETLNLWENGGLGPDALILEKGESRAERTTRFVHNDWVKDLTGNIHLIPLLRRRAFIDALTKLFHEFAEDHPH